MLAAVSLLDTAPLPAFFVNSAANSLVPEFFVPASPLRSTLLRPLRTVHSKELPAKLSPLDSALTKKGGGGSAFLASSLGLRPACSVRRALEQFRQPILPQHCPGMRAVPVGLLAFGNQHELSVLQAFCF